MTSPAAPSPPSTNRWVLGARPRTLPAAVVPVLVGTAAWIGVEPSDGSEGGVIVWRFVAAMIVSLALQLATNYVNDYADGERGTDDDRVGPIRLVGSGLATAKEVKLAAATSFGVAGVVGGALALAVGPELFVVGALSMLAGWAYTGGPRPYGYLGLGEVFVFIFFGVVATVGSFYVQGREVSILVVLASVAVGCLAVALLVINNLRDIPGDTVAGKATLAVRLGDATTRKAYVGLFVLTAVCIVAVGVSRPPALIGLAGLVLAVPPIKKVLGGAKGAELIPVLGETGKTQLATGALFALGLALGG